MKRHLPNHPSSDMIYATYINPVLYELARLGVDIEKVIDEGSVAGTTQAADLPPAERLYGQVLAILERKTRRADNNWELSYDLTETFCLGMVACATLEQVLTHARKFYSCLPIEVALEFSCHDDQVYLCIDTARSDTSTASALSEITASYIDYQIFSWLIGRPIPLNKVLMRYSEANASVHAARFFSSELAFDQAYTCLVFDAHYLEAPVVRSQADIMRAYARLSLGFPATRCHQSRSLGQQVRTMIMNALLNGHPVPSLSEVAASLHMSTSTFQRRLKDEDIRYQMIQSECRQKLAQQLLSQRERSLLSIAEQLGFADLGSFRRAFYQWTGLSPSEYRRFQ